MTKQAIASVTRQIVAVVGSIYGIVSTHISAIHLPPAASAVLVAAGPVILAIEHFVSDPSTGTAAQAVKVIDATPEVHRIVADARAELVGIVNAARVFVTPPAAATEPPAAIPAVPAPVAPLVTP